MKNLIALFATALLFWSCTNSKETTFQPEDLIESQDVIEYKILDDKATLDNSVEIDLSQADNRLVAIVFEIVDLEIGYASRARCSNSIQMLDSSIYGYCGALESEVLIGGERNWSDGESFVLGTTIGNAGFFTGNIARYLGFRVQVDDDYQYGWVLARNNNNNTSVQVESYAINTTIGNGILAGQTE